MEPRHYFLGPKSMTDWGDRGLVLQHGLGHVLPRQEGLIVLLRTGPFVPPLTFPAWPSFDARGSGIVATANARAALEASNLTGLAFQPVIKGRIAPLPWHEWDLHAAEPPVRPPEGRPEGYLLADHCPETSAAVGDLWELVALRGERRGESDFFSIPPTGTLWCTERARAWLENEWTAWVSFREPEAGRTGGEA